VYFKLLESTGGSLELFDFEFLARDEGVTMRTIKRDLEMWTRITEFNVEESRVLTGDSGQARATWRVVMPPKAVLKWWRGKMEVLRMIEVSAKYCSKCGRTRRADEFGRDRSKRDGLQHYCAECLNKIAKKVYQKDLKKSRRQRLETQKRYLKRLKRTEK